MTTIQTLGYVCLALSCSREASARQATPSGPNANPTPQAAPQESGATREIVKAPEDYVIGTDDVLTVSFWREKDLSTDVVVRPDGKITLPINDVYAVD